MSYSARKNRRGNYMMLMGGMLPIMVGFAALSIDISYIQMSQSQIQHVADGAAHGAFVAYRASNNDETVGNAAADWIIEHNPVTGVAAEKHGALQFGQYDFNAHHFDPDGNYYNSARVTLHRSDIEGNPVELFFAPLLGYNKWDVAATGVTAGLSRQIMLVQDVSCSFAGVDIQNSRNAQVAFIDYIHAHPYPKDKVGLVMFGGQAIYPVLYELSDLDVHYAAMRAEFLKINICTSLPSELRAGPQHVWYDCATTQARGLIDAREQFIAHGNTEEFQAVVIISDGGANVGLSKYAHTTGGFSQDLYSGANDSIRAANQLWGEDSNGNDMTHWEYYTGEYTAYCNGNGCYYYPNQPADVYHDSTFDGGVNMWSVFFNAGANDPTNPYVVWMHDNMKKGLGEAYNTTDSSQLAQIMAEIASSIPVVMSKEYR